MRRYGIWSSRSSDRGKADETGRIRALCRGYGGEAIIGDLAPPDQIMDDGESKASWALIRARGAKKIFPSHGVIFALQA